MSAWGIFSSYPLRCFRRDGFAAIMEKRTIVGFELDHDKRIRNQKSIDTKFDQLECIRGCRSFWLSRNKRFDRGKLLDSQLDFWVPDKQREQYRLRFRRCFQSGIKSPGDWMHDWPRPSANWIDWKLRLRRWWVIYNRGE